MKKSQKNMLLLSGSKAAGNLPSNVNPGFLDWAEKWVQDFFCEAKSQQKPILFVPYARAGGASEQDYFSQVFERFQKMQIELICAGSNGIQKESLHNVGGIFIGGGHTPTLLHKLQTTHSISVIQDAVNAGLPYLGSSAGTLITCPTIKTNNDMPGPAHDVIDLKSLNLIHAQLNCHYMDDAMHDPKHQGETRDLRLREFCIFNPDVNVLGLYEGQALRVIGDRVFLWTSKNARGFKTPIFRNKTRIEIQCEVGVEKEVSEFFSG